MCSENVTSVPQFSFGSGLGSRAYLPVAIPEAQTESDKFLHLGVVSCAGGGLGGLPTLPIYQILHALHGKHGVWTTQASLPSQAVGPFGSPSSTDGSDKHRHSLWLDAPLTPCQKRAKCAPYSIHRHSKDTISTLPDELLCHIFHFLGTARDRAACGFVSKRWLMLQSHMSRENFVDEEGGDACGKTESNTPDEGGCGDSDDDVGDESSVSHRERWGDLSRCLSGHKASDVRLAAIALGTDSRGGLGKLCIRGGSATGLEVRVTDVGLSAIGLWCSGLRVLSLWKCPFIKDEGLSAVGKGCGLLEKVDLFKCPLLGDSGVKFIAKSCSRLSFLNLDECEKVSDLALVAVAEHSSDITTLNVQNCPLVSDYGITRVVCSLKKLKKLKLGGLNLSDESLRTIGSQGNALLWLTLLNLDQVTADGFMSLGNAAGMQALKHLHISNCRNFTDFALAMVGNYCRSLKHTSLHRCEQVSDKGLVLFMKIASCLQVLHLEKCNLITGTGLVAALSARGKELRELQVTKCEGIRQIQAVCPPYIPRSCALESICLADCPGVGDLGVALVGLLCPEAASMDFTGLTDITDDGLLAFLCGSRKLSTLKLSGCANVTDRAICAVAHQCGKTLRNLVLDGCKHLSDKSLKAISSHCPLLEDLDVSECGIGDAGLKALVDNVGLVLTSLNLSGCRGITDKVLPLICKKCDSLLDLNLKNCSGLSESGVSEFQSRMWNCTVMY